ALALGTKRARKRSRLARRGARPSRGPRNRRAGRERLGARRGRPRRQAPARAGHLVRRGLRLMNPKLTRRALFQGALAALGLWVLPRPARAFGDEGAFHPRLL